MGGRSEAGKIIASGEFLTGRAGHEVMMRLTYHLWMVD